jgi:hypothetical protein
MIDFHISYKKLDQDISICFEDHEDTELASCFRFNHEIDRLAPVMEEEALRD